MRGSVWAPLLRRIADDLRLHLGTEPSGEPDQVRARLRTFIVRVRAVQAWKPRAPASLLGLARPDLLVERHLEPLCEEGLLERTHPETPNHPAQVYGTTAKARQVEGPMAGLSGLERGAGRAQRPVGSHDAERRTCYAQDQAGTKRGPSRDQAQLLEGAQEPRPMAELMVLSGRRNRTKFRSRAPRATSRAPNIAGQAPRATSPAPNTANSRYRALGARNVPHRRPPELPRTGERPATPDTTGPWTSTTPAPQRATPRQARTTTRRESKR